MPIPKKILARQREIVSDYLKIVDDHLLDIIHGRVAKMFEIRDIAALMHIHPTHLTNTVKLATGEHPCMFYERKLVALSKNMLEENKMSINAIASLLTYDPSNFTKFFKKFAGTTPSQYREAYLTSKLAQKTEILTI
jgi:AraC-like DNA-binding protein